MAIHGYFDYGSIYSYLAWYQIEHGHTDLDWSQVLWKPVSAYHIVKQDGHGTNAEYPNWNQYTIQDAMRIAKRVGSPLVESQVRPHNAIQAMRLHFLADQGGPTKERAWMRTVFQGIFEQGQDPQDPATLSAWCEQVGIQDGPQACNHESLKNLLIQNTGEAYHAGAPGVPYFVRDGEGFWGQDRLSDLTRASL